MVGGMRNLSKVSIVLALALAACGPSGGDASTTTVGGDTTTSSSSAETTTSAPAPSTTVESTDPTAAPTGAGGPDCLVGTWELDSDAFIEGLAELFASAEMGATEVTGIGGVFSTELSADGSARAVREGWGFTIQSDEGNVTIEINGEETGTWAADDATVTLDLTSSNLTVDSRVEVDGQVIDLPSSPVEVPETIATASEYMCDGDTLTITNDSITSVMTRG